MNWMTRLLSRHGIEKDADPTLAYELDPDVVDAFATPATNERAVAKAVREAGGDERTQVAAILATRAAESISDAFDRAGVSMPAEVRKEIRSLWGGEKDVPAPSPKQVAKETKPEPVPRPALTPEQIAKAQEAAADRELETVIAEIRKEDSSLTREQAYSRALDRRPELYRSQTAAFEVRGETVPAPALPARLAKAASALRSKDPGLTEAQSIAKALDDDPSLYLESR